MKKKVIVFGTGFIYETIKEILFAEYEIVSLIDNNQLKWNLKQDGILISNPQIVSEIEYDIVVIAASHIEEMANQLSELGVAEEKIIIGANYAIRQSNPNKDVEITYLLDDSNNIVCNYKNKNEDLISLNIFDNKKLLMTTHNISTLLEIYDNNNLNDFLSLSAKYYNNPKGIFLDIGANIGTTCLHAVENNNVTHCIAFEPSTDNYSLLMSNIYVNKLQEKITGYKYAVGEKSEINQLMLSPRCSGDNRLRKDAKADYLYQGEDLNKIDTEDVETIVIDSFLSEKINDVKFIWIDIQGYEYFALKGCENLIKNHDVAVQIEYWPFGLNETNSIALLNEFLSNNFKYFIDMDEKEIVQDINNIFSLEDKLVKINKNKFTDIFLIK